MPTSTTHTGDVFSYDDQDAELVLSHKWYLSGGRTYCGKQYIVCKVKGKVTYLHRLIARPSKTQLVDHINGNTHDNQRSNLRIVDRTQNAHNRQKAPNCSSVFKGVSRVNNRWKATINNNKKQKHLGYYASEHEAATAYNNAAKEYFGEYALLNDL